MKTQSSNSKTPDRSEKRPWKWAVILAAMIGVLVIGIHYSHRWVSSDAKSSTPSGGILSPPKTVAFQHIGASPLSSKQAVVQSAQVPPALLFDSNKLSGGVLFSKGRDDKFIPDSGAPSGWSLWARNADGTERLVNASVVSAKFSPDGQRIAYTTSGCTLQVEDLQGNQLSQVEGGYCAQWKPDGSTIVFSKVPEGRDVYAPETFHLATLDPASGKVTLLTDGRFDDGRPEFHPSGDWILFVSGGRNGLASFWKLDLGNGEPVQVTNIGQRAVDETFVPTPYRKTIWSPDGRWFLYDFKSGERKQIWGLHFAASGDLMNAAKLADGLDPTWTEEGKTFVYSTQVNGHPESAVGTLP